MYWPCIPTGLPFWQSSRKHACSGVQGSLPVQSATITEVLGAHLQYFSRTKMTSDFSICLISSDIAYRNIPHNVKFCKCETLYGILFHIEGVERNT